MKEKKLERREKREFPNPWQLVATTTLLASTLPTPHQPRGPPSTPTSASAHTVLRRPPQSIIINCLPAQPLSEIDPLSNLVHNNEWGGTVRDRGCSYPSSRPRRHPEPVGGAVHVGIGNPSGVLERGRISRAVQHPLMLFPIR
jgi:hypothetical protein